jgi:hypothetical protein
MRLLESLMNAPGKLWAMRHRLLDLMHVLHRPAEIAVESGHQSPPGALRPGLSPPQPDLNPQPEGGAQPVSLGGRLLEVLNDGVLFCFHAQRIAPARMRQCGGWI